MSLNAKLLVMSLVGFVVIFGISISITYLYYGNVTERRIEKTLQESQHNLEVALAAKKKVWRTNALQIANNAQLKQALVNKYRERADRILSQLGRVFKENTGFNNVKVHVIDQDLQSSYKSWNPDSYGQEVGASKVYTLFHRPQEPAVAMEVSPKGMRSRGSSP